MGCIISMSGEPRDDTCAHRPVARGDEFSGPTTRREEVGALCREMLAASPSLTEEAAKALLQQVPCFKNPYEPGKIALENYRKVPGLWIEMDRYLEERYPEVFIAIREKYAGQIEAIDREIEGLGQVNA